MPDIVYGVAVVIVAGLPETLVECAMSAVGAGVPLVVSVPVLVAAAMIWSVVPAAVSAAVVAVAGVPVPPVPKLPAMRWTTADGGGKVGPPLHVSSHTSLGWPLCLPSQLP